MPTTKPKNSPEIAVSDLRGMKMSSAMIHYYTFPSLLLTIGIWVFDRLLASPPESVRLPFFSLVLGFLIVTLVPSRLPLVATFFIPIAVLLFIRLTGRPTRALRRSYGYVALGAVVATASLGSFFAYVGFLDIYLSRLSRIFSPHCVNAGLLTPTYAAELYVRFYAAAAYSFRP